ncbi:MAG: hypothetical protein ACTSYE_11555, partial [Alphaproteobacteria bacterium]
HMACSPAAGVCRDNTEFALITEKKRIQGWSTGCDLRGLSLTTPLSQSRGAISMLAGYSAIRTSIFRCHGVRPNPHNPADRDHILDSARS